MSSINFPLNVISPKALEKQLKLVEGRIAVLQAEMAELEKIQNACLVLMGTGAPVEAAEATNPATKNRKKKTDEAATEEEVDVISPSEVMASEAGAAH